MKYQAYTHLPPGPLPASPAVAVPVQATGSGISIHHFPERTFSSIAGTAYLGLERNWGEEKGWKGRRATGRSSESYSQASHVEEIVLSFATAPLYARSGATESGVAGKLVVDGCDGFEDPGDGARDGLPDETVFVRQADRVRAECLDCADPLVRRKRPARQFQAICGSIRVEREHGYCRECAIWTATTDETLEVQDQEYRLTHTRYALEKSIDMRTKGGICGSKWQSQTRWTGKCDDAKPPASF